MNRPTVGVMGSGTDEHADHAEPLGELLAELGVHLLTGGGPGVMRAVSRGFTRGALDRGLCIGVLPCDSESDRGHVKAGYPNEFVELAIRTHLPLSGARGTDDLSRNHVNVLSSDVIVALPGDAGTASEVALARTYGRPIVIFAPRPDLAARLPRGVPRLADLDGVRAFLLEALEPLGWPAGDAGR